jgi:hypothetical protein
MRRTVPLASLLAFAVFSLALPDAADAIPAFARKYGVSCTLCHAPAPRLKAFGEEFAGRGFRMQEPGAPAAPEGEPPRGTTPTGDALLELPDRLPLAVRIEAHGAYREDADAEADLESPWVFKLLSGGPLAPKISYYAYFIIEQGDVAGLEDAYLQFSKLFGGGIDLLVGQFQVSDPLFKRELRLSRADYEIYRVRVGKARANLTYDRGLMFLGTAPGEVDIAFQVVNGNGIPEGEFDNDSNKNLALRLSRGFGPLRFGLFGYRGEEDGPAGVHSNEIVYWGPDLTVTPHPDWELNLQYLERSDDDPEFLGGGAARELDTSGGFAELLWFPDGIDGRWSVAALYNRVDSDDPAAERDDLALSIGYLTARNIRFVGEVGRDRQLEANRASIGIVAAF